MGRPVLLLRLEGVWQSWGERSRWDVRDTGTEPTKSGIVGLLGCALGYPMRDPRLENELDAGLRFGVRVENAGRVVQDYQTVSGFLPTAEGSYRHMGATAKSLDKLKNSPDVTPSTIVSPRYYLEDASFLAALEEKDGFNGLLSKCEAALREPKWPIFLGRKACVPTRPVLERFIDDYSSIEEALEQYEWSWLRSCKEDRSDLRPKKLAVMIETANGELWRQDVVQMNQARQYGFRRVHSYTVNTPAGGES
ncbi:MAG: type I-E CRISPR-associated protein Cas5/CasD [Armatimonadota bacterium]